MKNVLIMEEDKEDSAQIFPFLNYLLDSHAAVYRERKDGIIFDCVIVEAREIIVEQDAYLESFRVNTCTEDATIVAISSEVKLLSHPKVIEFSDIMADKKLFVTLNEKLVADLFCVMWNKSITWNKRWA
jgi:hypothetical protein